MDENALDHVTPGMMLPHVALPATDGTDIAPAALPGRSIIAVYPWTGRPGRPNPPHWDDIQGAHGSTPELEGFRDLHERFARADTRIFGLSPQAQDYQLEVVERLRLPFPILSDAEGVFADALALPTFSTGSESYLKRLTLAVSDGHVEWVFYPVSDPAGHAGEVLHWLETLA
ncbi:MAG TPA: peroxiredoxin [Methyloceanibacter sp.]|nr:peroxiredoxin [Methyloceanibacter sp.]